MFRIGHFGLRGRSIIFGSALLALAVCAISTALTMRNHASRVARASEYAVDYAHALAHTIQTDLERGDFAAIRSHAHTAGIHTPLHSAHFLDSELRPIDVAGANTDDGTGLTAKDFDRLSHGGHSYVVTTRHGSLIAAVAVWPNDRETIARPSKAGADVEPLGYVVVEHGMDTVRAGLRGDIAYSLIIGGIVMLLGMGLTTLITDQLLRPIHNLAETTHAISRGELTKRAKEDSVGEVGDLARTFNRMADTLAEYTGNLETQVQSRTQELEARSRALESEIADRKRAEEALANTQALLRAAIEHSPAGIIIADAPGGQIRMANPAAFGIRQPGCEDITNIPLEMYSEKWQVLRPDGTLFESDQLPLSRAILHGETTQNIEAIVRRPDGEHRWILASAAPVRDATGRIIAGMVVFPDITDLKAAAEELRKAKDEAEASNRLKSEFLANMSHEIRTPMTAILGFAETLQDETSTERERAEMIQTIRRNGEHLLQIINDILDISKIEAGRLEPEILSCNPCQLIAEVASMMRQRAAGKGLYLRVQYAGSIPSRIQTDPVRLRQALINLVGNAVKFTELGGVTIRVGLNGTETEPLLRVEVIDTGVGLHPEQLGRILEPFRQADTSTTRRYGGTGLGLAITSRIAELLGGRLEVDSEEGKGSVFSLRVGTGPLDGIEFIDQPIEEAASRYQIDRGPYCGSLDTRVLLVEDGPDNQRLISVVLRKAGAEVALAQNGQEGVEMALEAAERGEPYDIILMDMQMPVMDGYQATRTLRARHYDLPIVALTAHAMEGDKEKCLEAGCDDFATKPISRRSLIEAVQRNVQGMGTCGGSRAYLPEDTELPATRRTDDALSPEAQAAAEEEKAGSMAERVRPGEIQPTRVLIADDDGELRGMCKRLLERAGYEVVEARDGLEVLEYTPEIQPDLIIMDTAMPNVDGLECTRRLKADPRTRDIPVIIVSVLARGDEIIAGLEAGVDEYITKPIRPREFVLRVQTMVLLQKSKSDLVRANEIRGEQARSLGIIQDLSAALSTSDSIDSIAMHAVHAAAQLTCSRRVSLMLPTEDESSLKVISALGFDLDPGNDTLVPIETSIAGKVFRSGEAIIVNKPELKHHDDLRYDSEVYTSAPLVSQALNANERIVGVLNITNRLNGRPFDRCDLGYVDLICNMVAAAIDEFSSRQSRDQARDSVVVAMATLAEYRDVDTGKHLERVTRYAELLALELQKDHRYARFIDEQFMKDLKRAIPLHDIGKVAIPDHILLKPGYLSPEEMNLMRRHAKLGADTLQAIIARTPGASFLRMAQDIALTHHEWYNGNGYPNQLAGDEIPLCGRIAALADVYDALTTKRPYKEPFPHETAKKMILEARGTQFDPDVVDAFLARESEFIRLAVDLADEPTEADRTQVLITELHHRITTIEHAVLDRDLDMLRSLAEQFKHAARACGLPEIGDLASEVENCARANAELEHIADEVRKLAALCREVQFSTHDHAMIQADPRA